MTKTTSKYSLWQFVKDGLVGLLITTLGFGVLWIALGGRIGLYFYQEPFLTELFHFYSLMFSFQDSFISPLPSVMLIGFISVGIGGRFLENITFSRGWIKPILIISIISWIIGISSFIILYQAINWNTIAIMSFAAIIGFLIASLAGIVFNPAKRLFRLLIGTVASTVVGCGVGFWMYLFQIL